MKILENISSGYKRIATGIAIIGFLSMLYLAMIPGATLAHVYGPNGGVLSGAFVFIKEWPQYNDTTAIDGSYAIEQMPIGEYTFVAAGNDSVAPYIAPINVTVGNNNLPDITLSPAITYYMPFLYQRDDHVGFDYVGGMQVQNNGTVNASIEKIFYNKNGTIAGNDFLLLQPDIMSESKPFELTNIYPIFASAGVIKSEYPVQVQGYILTKDLQVYSLAPSYKETSTKSYLPFLYHRVDHVGFDYDSGIQMFNPGNVVANVNIVLINKADATEAANVTFTLDPKNQVSKPLSGLVGGFSIWNGPAVITSDQPIVSQGYIRTTDSKVYSIAPSVSTPVYSAFLPFLYHRVDHVGFDYDSGIQVFNPGNIVANITLKLYNKADGTEAANITYPVNPNIQNTRTLSSLVGGFAIWNGPAEITSDQPVVVQGFIRTTASKIYSIAPQVRKPESPIDIHIPFLYQTVSASHDSGIQVTNPNLVSASVDETLYYRNGTMAGTVNIIIPPYQQVTRTAFQIAPSTTNFDGYALISANQSVVAQAFIRQKTANIYSIAPPVER